MGKLKAVILFILASALIARSAMAGADLPRLKVVPWNGHKAATSLTFDDSDPSHLDVAVPELTQRGMRGTFFLIANRTDRKDEWRKILVNGNEIGNHTLDHKHADELTRKDEEAQVVGAHNVLQKEFGVAVNSFAYPYTEITPGLKAWVGKTHLLARGGYGKSFVLTPSMEPDWLDIPSRGTQSKLPFSTYKSWIAENVKKGGWLVWRIHGLEGTPWGYEPISKKIFQRILDEIRSKDIWVGTFSEVGAYYRAQKIFEKAVIQKSGQGEIWSWEIPDHFPSHLNLKVQLSKGSDKARVEIRQSDQIVEPDAAGFYTIDFGQKKIALEYSPDK